VNAPLPLPAAQNMGSGMQGVTAHFSVPVVGVGGLGPCGWLLLLPLDFPGTRGRGSRARLCYRHGSMVGDWLGDTMGERGVSGTQEFVSEPLCLLQLLFLGCGLCSSPYSGLGLQALYSL